MSTPKTKTLLFKYGGNAMTDEALKREVLAGLGALHQKGYRVVIVHGGGPFIQKILSEAQIKSHFIDGHRQTTPEALRYVEMALKGEVNGSLVSLLNAQGHRAVGLSGKDGKSVEAVKRYHHTEKNGVVEKYDLGQVGDVKKVNTQLTEMLLNADYLPVFTCLADDENGASYNINADMFAGHLAGALGAEYIIMTDVDGLREDKDRPETLMKEIKANDIETLVQKGIIQGGMLPKMESCQVALAAGATGARIINGTKPAQLRELSAGNSSLGTLITR